MFITISDISKRLYPLDYIDNRSGNLRIGLRRITFCLDWYNTSYGYISIDNFLAADSDFAKHEYDETNGIAKITPVGDATVDFYERSEIQKMLKIKFDPGRREKCTETYICKSYGAVDFMPVKLLNVHCNQINSKDNFFDMTPSTILTTVPVGKHKFGDIITRDFTSPEYKRLKSGALTNLKIDLLDQDNKEIIHHTKIPVSCTLEIIP